MATVNNRWTAVILVTMIAAGVNVIKGQAGKVCRADICFVLDESGSIDTQNWQKCKQFVANFIDGTKFGESGTKYGIVKFSETANLAIPLNQYPDKNSLLMAVRNLGYDRGGTAIHSGIRVAREQCFTTDNGDRSDEYAPNILILMTDGKSNKSRAIQQANLARDRGIILVSIGIGDYELDTLKAIAYSLDGDRLFTFENFDQLLNDVSLILDESCRSVRECDRSQLVHLTGNYPNIEDCPFLTDPYLVDNTQIEFGCNITYNDSLVTSDARYNVTFLFDGQTDVGVPSQIITPPDTIVILEERYLSGRLNKYISCQVESYFVTSSTTEISPAIRSRRYWAGIAPSRRLINLYEGDDKPTDLYFFSTLPIRCEYYGQPDIQCHITLEVSATSNRIAMYQPSTNNFTQIRSCAFKLFYNDWKENESLAYDEHGPLQLLPKKDPHSSNPMTVILSVNVRGQPDAAFEKYHLNNITIFVHDQKPGICRIQCDPWITTFDRSSSYSAMQQGYFVYVRSNSIRKFEIQGRHFPYQRGGGSGCSIACAVVVREGKYVLAIDKCNENNELHILKLTTKFRPVNGLEVIDENFLIQMTANPSRTEYMIKTSGGARVVVTLRSRGINIQITLSARDKGKTSGLCGTFDDDPTNDFIPNGETASIKYADWGELNRFIESWRISKKQSLFGKEDSTNYGNDTGNSAALFCNCAGNYNRTYKPIDGAKCGLNALEDPLSDVDKPQEYVRALIPKYIRNGLTKRKKREINEREFRTDDVTDYVLTDYPDTTKNGPPPAWGSGSFNVTEDQARQACIEAIDSSPAVSSCQSLMDNATYNDMIVTCLMDIQRTESLEWAVDRRREFEQICVAMIITQNVTDRQGDLTTMMMNNIATVTNVLCPADCSNNGRCVDGTCQCSTDYLGADCSIKKGQVPVLKKYLIEDGCDMTDMECRAMRVVVNGAANTPNLACKIIITKPNGGGTIEKTYPGQLETPTLVRCPLPSISEVAGNVVGYSYKVQISNDRVHYSIPLQKSITVQDSKCTVCVNDSCSQKPNTCIIDNKCYNNGEEVSDCLICNSSKTITGGSPKPGVSLQLISNKVWYKVATETMNIQLESSDSTTNVVFSLRGTPSGVSISSTGVMTWTLESPSQNITVRLALKNCPQIQYTDVTLTLIILSCNDICGMNAICIRNVNTPSGHGNYTCRCKDDSQTYCHPNACPTNVPCRNMTCGYRCDYPTGTWSGWSSYTSCNKPCDYGLKERKRTCLGSPCFGELVDIAVCNSFNCPEIESQKGQSVILEFQRISVKKIVLKRKVIHNFIAAALNDYCVKAPDICCRSVDFRAKPSPIGADKIFTDDDIKEAAGYPKTVKVNVRWMLYVEVYTGNLLSVCEVPSGKRLKRAAFSEFRTVNPALLKAVLSEKTDQLSSLVQTNVTLVEPSDSSINDIIIAVSCLGVIVAVAVVTIILVVLLRSSQRKKRRRRRQVPVPIQPKMTSYPPYNPSLIYANYVGSYPSTDSSYPFANYSGTSSYPTRYFTPRYGPYASVQDVYNTSPDISRRRGSNAGYM